MAMSQAAPKSLKEPINDSLAIVRSSAADAARLFANLSADEALLQSIAQAGEMVAGCLKSGNKVLCCGNGGSMADAIHLAEELSGCFRSPRRPLAAIALSDPGHLSCVANDMGFEEVFARAVFALARPGDLLVAFSTSGSSPNIVKAAEAALQVGGGVLAVCGRAESALVARSTHAVITPGGPWADRVQELHSLVLHLLVEVTEARLGLSEPTGVLAAPGRGDA